MTTNQSLAYLWATGERKLNYNDDIFCISPMDNKYLTSFDYSFNFNSQSKLTNLSLKFLDTDGLFLNKFFKIGNISLPENPNNFSTEELLARYNSLSDHVIYFSFGTNLINGGYYWSDVMQSVLVSMDIEIADKGVREYFLNYQNSTNALLFYRQMPPPYNFLNHHKAHFSSYESVDVIMNVPLIDDHEPEEERGDAKVGEPKIKQKYFTDLLKEYIAGISNTIPGNVICIIPPWLSNKDLVDLAKDKVNEILKANSFFLGEYHKPSDKQNGTHGISHVDSMEQQNSSETKSLSLSFGVKKKVGEEFPNVTSTLEDIYSYFTKKYQGVGFLGESYMVIDNNFSNQIRYKKFGLIKDETKPIVIFSFENMMNTYFFKQKALQTIGKIELASSEIDPQLARLGDLLEVVENDSKNVTYNENLDLITNGVVEGDIAIRDYIKEINKTSDLNGIQLFVHNATNPNVLNLRLSSRDTFYAGLRGNLMDAATNAYTSILGERLLQSEAGTKETEKKMQEDFKKATKFRLELEKFAANLVDKPNNKFKDLVIEKLTNIRGKLAGVSPAFIFIQNLTKAEIKLTEPAPGVGEFGLSQLDVEQNVKVTFVPRATEYSQNKVIVSDEILILMYVLLVKDGKWEEFTKPLPGITFSTRLTTSEPWPASVLPLPLPEKSEREFLSYYDRAVVLNTLVVVDIDQASYDKSVDAATRAAMELPPLITFKAKLTNKKSVFHHIDNAEKYLSNRIIPELTIQTLPLFNINSIPKLFNKFAYVISKKIKILSTNELVRQDDSFITGFYRIIGFKHVINSKECNSNFILTKFNYGN